MLKSALFPLLLLQLACTNDHPKQAFESGLHLQEIESGLHLVVSDSSSTQGILVEQEDGLALLEASFSSKGGGTKDLQEHLPEASALLELLESRFPGQGLKRVLHSHWHPHSMAALTPFLEKGARLYTTEDNFERTQEMLPEGWEASYGDQINIIEGDSLHLPDALHPITAYRVTKEELKSLPTKDYLFFHLPGSGLLQCGCMFSRQREAVKGRPLKGAREQDLLAFIQDRELPVEWLARLYSSDSLGRGLRPFSDLDSVVTHGISTKELAAPFHGMSADSMRGQREELVREAVSQNLPARLLNRLVYFELGRKDLDKALEYALLQVRVTPTNANAWDSLGETYFFRGELELARHAERSSLSIDPAFEGGGEKVWAEDLLDHEKKWQEKGL